jgi:hypothetical protein
VSNRGRFPFTVLGLARRDLALFTPASSAAFEVSPPSKGVNLSGPFFAAVTLKPGQQAAVRLVLRANRCWPMSAGAYLVLTDLPVRVRHLGITSTQSLPLFNLPLYVTDDQSPDRLPAGCST